MKHTIFLGVIAALLLSSFTPHAGSDLFVEIKGFRNSNGYVLLSIFNNADGFPGDAEKAIIREKAEVRNGRCQLAFRSLAEGTYAISVLHDENRNLKMDMKLFVLPKEGFGFSQDPGVAFGPPRFSKASFRHSGEQHIVITIKYF